MPKRRRRALKRGMTARALEREISRDIAETAAVSMKLQGHVHLLVSIAREAAKAVKGGRKIMIFGNGGSAADSQHIAAELVGRFAGAELAVPALALTTDTSVLTALSNDFSFDDVFSRQVKALANRGDFVIGLSTSGRSKNVISAIRTAKKMGALTLALTGREGGKLARAADRSIRVPSDDTQRIQEAHALIGHILCLAIKSYLLLR